MFTVFSLFVSIYIVSLCFFRKDLLDETSQMSPSRLRHVQWFGLSFWREDQRRCEEKQRNDRRSLCRLSQCDGPTGREKWTGANRNVDWKFVLFQVVVCLIWLSLQQISCDDRNLMVSTNKRLHPQTYHMLCVCIRVWLIFWHWYWFQLFQTGVLIIDIWCPH